MKRPPLNSLIAYLYVVMAESAYMRNNHDGMLHNTVAGKVTFDQITLYNLLWKWWYLAKRYTWKFYNLHIGRGFF